MMKCQLSVRFALRSVRQLLVTAYNNQAHPLFVAHHSIRLHADLRVGPHPIDFLPHGGEAIQIVIVVNEGNGHDVGLRALGAPQPAQMHVGQQPDVLFMRNFLDEHANPLLSCGRIFEKSTISDSGTAIETTLTYDCRSGGAATKASAAK